MTMNTRRNFLKSLGVAGIATAAGVASSAQAAPDIENTPDQIDDRIYWLQTLQRLATPVLTHLSRRELKRAMPVEAANPPDRRQYTHLEAFGRTMCGLAPWLASTNLPDAEESQRRQFTDLAHASLDAATDPQSPDFLNFTRGGQPLVDTAFLAQGILRAPNVLWQNLDARVQTQVVQAFKSSRSIPTPTRNNWVLFAAMVEAALHYMGEPTLKPRLEDCVTRMLAWYKGDGTYGDGEPFHFDYYNSFVIHPMLLDVLAVLKEKDKSYEPTYATALKRAQRYAVIQERLISPDGTFPSIGRSTTYRFGAFHALAQISLMGQLPDSLKPAQVRAALTAVMRKTLSAPETFDDQGWLRIGFCGHQPALAEQYISTGSLYLCTAALLPLGLPPADPFWSSPPAPWTSQQLWSGQNLPADHALPDSL
jgi:hypothetical protein